MGCFQMFSLDPHHFPDSKLSLFERPKFGWLQWNHGKLRMNPHLPPTPPGNKAFFPGFPTKKALSVEKLVPFLSAFFRGGRDSHGEALNNDPTRRLGKHQMVVSLVRVPSPTKCPKHSGLGIIGTICPDKSLIIGLLRGGVQGEGVP